MKTKLFLTALAVTASLCGYAQTKGTNTLGFGVNSATSKTESNASSQDSESKQTIVSLGYGIFIKDNTRIGIDLLYGKVNHTISNSQASGQDQNESQTYGGSLSYQQYYPLFKTLYAYAGGSGGFSSGSSESTVSPDLDYRRNNYSLGAYGGLTWFATKRFAFETTLLSAAFNYNSSKMESKPNNLDQFTLSQKETSFKLNTSGLIDGLGFKIYLLF